MSEQPSAPEEQIMQWITSKWITKPLFIASELGIPDLLNNGPKSVSALANETNTHQESLRRMMRALSSVGVFADTGDDNFGLTPLSKCLLSDAMRPIARMFLSEWHEKAWNALDFTIRSGKPGFDHAFGKPAFEWMEQNRSERKVFDQAQAAKSKGFAKSVIEVHDFSNFNTICDVGGGQGVFLIQILKSYPQIKGFVADLPITAAAAEKEIEKADLGDRCKVVSLDFLQDAPPVCDAYLLVNVLHNWEDEVCCQILKNIGRSMLADSKLWVVEYILEPGPGFSVAKLLDLEVLVMGGGRERFLDEYGKLLDSVGLEQQRIVPTESGLILIECVKKSDVV